VQAGDGDEVRRPAVAERLQDFHREPAPVTQDEGAEQGPRGARDALADGARHLASEAEPARRGWTRFGKEDATRPGCRRPGGDAAAFQVGGKLPAAGVLEPPGRSQTRPEDRRVAPGGSGGGSAVHLQEHAAPLGSPRLPGCGRSRQVHQDAGSLEPGAGVLGHGAPQGELSVQRESGERRRGVPGPG